MTKTLRSYNEHAWQHRTTEKPQHESRMEHAQRLRALYKYNEVQKHWRANESVCEAGNDATALRASVTQTLTSRQLCRNQRTRQNEMFTKANTTRQNAMFEAGQRQLDRMKCCGDQKSTLSEVR